MKDKKLVTADNIWPSDIIRATYGIRQWRVLSVHADGFGGAVIQEATAPWITLHLSWDDKVELIHAATTHRSGS